MIGALLHGQSFRAVGTECVVAVTAGYRDIGSARRALAAGCSEVSACERALSRFDPASDLCRLNAACGSWVTVGERLSAALAVALAERESTGGRYDPTILPVLAAAGYDRSFELIEERPPVATAGWRPGAAVELDHGSLRARVPGGAMVDLGGIGKGFAAERALDAMKDAWPGLPGGLVDLGGDVAVRGATPEGGPWLVAVADPRAPGTTLGALELWQGGVATSGRDTRRFGPGRRLHHLIDPFTGRPAERGPLAVTVAAVDAAKAEAHATALAVTRAADACAYLAARPLLGAVVVPDEGAPVVIGSLSFVEESRHLEVSA